MISTVQGGKTRIKHFISKNTAILDMLKAEQSADAIGISVSGNRFYPHKTGEFYSMRHNILKIMGGQKNQ
jgi:hypothetical protein